MGAFADVDAGGAEEQEGITGQVASWAEFLLQALILLRRKRLGQATRLRWQVFETSEIGRKGSAVGSRRQLTLFHLETTPAEIYSISANDWGNQLARSV
jgi:hypothetical protein